MQTIQVNGISLAYERRGKGPVLVLVHGFPLDHSTWAPLAEQLDPDFDLILPDLRGFGQSTAPAGPGSVGQMAADLAALLEALAIPQAFIAGHSMGGYVSLAFSRTYPEKVLGLALVSSQTAADSPERKAGRLASAQQVEQEGPTALLGMAEKLTADPRHIPFLREVILHQPVQGLIGALHALAERPDATQALSGFRAPLVLVHGVADVLIPIERAREIKTLLPHSHLTKLPGVGHSPALEAPLETAQALRGLLLGK